MTSSIIVPSDVSLIIKEIEQAYSKYIKDFNIPDDHKIIVNYSAGKDSTATLAIANHLFGDKVQAVMADTDNEHEWTIDYALQIHNKIDCNPIEIVKKIYSLNHFNKRIEAIKKGWSKKQIIRMGKYRGILMPALNNSESKFGQSWLKTAKRWGIDFDNALDACLSVMKPSGNSFLDAALIHGKFAQLRDRFCTDELKIKIVYDSVLKPLLDDGEIIVQWSGVRGDESAKRASYPRFSPDQRDSGFLYNFLPIHKISALDVFAIHKYFGVDPNPLYKAGCDRVGCMNCIFSSKNEIAETALRFPHHIKKHHEWEKVVRLTSRWVHWMSVGTFKQDWFKSYSKFGQQVNINGLNPEIQNIDWSGFYGPRGNMGSPNAYEVLEWAKTGRGGKTYDLVKASLDTTVCSSRYGLCE